MKDVSRYNNTGSGSPPDCVDRRLARVLRELHAAGGMDWSTIKLGTCEFGIGVFAARDMNAGEVILRFSGERVTFAEAAAKGDQQCYTLQTGDDEYINLDAPGRFVNHSCGPNSYVRGFELRALSNIVMGEEVVFDYSTTMDEDYWQMECGCRSANCRKVIGDFKHLPEALQEAYLSTGIVSEFLVRTRHPIEARRKAS